MDKIDLKLDTDSLTLGDLEDFEAAVGKTVDEVIRPVPELDDEGNRVFDERGRPSMTVKMSTKALIGLVWIVQRQKDPTFTLADARAIRVNNLIISEPEEDPNRGND